MTNRTFFCFCPLILAAVCVVGQTRAAEPLAFAEPVKIWDAGGHNAFTDIIRFNGHFYVTFREGTGHVPGKKTGDGDGTIRILRSDDGQEWKSVALLKRDRFDLRDAKLSETPDGRLLVTMGGSVYVEGKLVDRAPQISFSDKAGERFSDPADAKIDESIRSPFDWLWRVTWRDGVGYGVIYQVNQGDYHTAQNPEWTLWLVRTTDGVRYDKVTRLDVAGRPNEATVRFAPDGSMKLLARREADDRHAFLGTSVSPFTEWSWRDTGESIGGPNFLFLPDGTLFGGGRVKGKTGLGVFDAEGKYKNLTTLPSDGDNSYPGFCLDGDTLWVSYYSSHENKTSIYLTRIPVSDLEGLK